MGTERGPGERFDAEPAIPVQRILEEFRTLKAGGGLNPQKMAAARATLALMGEVYPVAGTQRLLDDLGDLDTEDGRALAWALRADPAIHVGTTLNARRAASGVPENTAKDREGRAVVALFDRWAQGREDWASSVFTVRCASLPAEGAVRFGSLSLSIKVFRDHEEDLPVVLFELQGPYPSSDFLTIASRADQALVIYGTASQTWRLELWLPSLGVGDVRVARVHNDRRPAMVRVEQSLPDGRATEERVSGERFDGETVITIRAPNLDPPCPISWDWTEPEEERRPAVVFPQEQIS